MVLYLMGQGLMQPFHDPLQSGTFDIQEIGNTYHQISLVRTRCMNSLFNHYVTLYFPEIERFFNSSRAEWFCRFMLKFPTPASITRYRQATFIKRAWDVVGRKVSKERLLIDIYQTAQQSVGLPVPSDSLAVETFKLQLNRFYKLTQNAVRLRNGQIAIYRHALTISGLKVFPGWGLLLP